MPEMSIWGDYSPSAILFLSLFFVLGFMLAILWLAWWILLRNTSCPSPYTGEPLRKAADLPYYTRSKVYRFMAEFSGYDNRQIELRKAAYCRETGRIFPNAINWYGTIRVDWSFIRKRFPGHYVSWGSLSKEMRDEVMQAHDSLEGFQTDVSSPQPQPHKIEPEYARSVPGPLYVDPVSLVLVGWQVVPETDLEVLIVQKPKPKPY